MQNESYFFYKVLFPRFVYFGKQFLTVERVNFSMDNGFKYACLVLNNLVNINILYVIMQLILLSGDLCCKHVIKVCYCTSLSLGIYPVLRWTVEL